MIAFHRCYECGQFFHAFCLGKGAAEDSTKKKCAKCDKGFAPEAIKLHPPSAPSSWTGRTGYIPLSNPLPTEKMTPANNRASQSSKSTKKQTRKSSGRISGASILAGPDIYCPAAIGASYSGYLHGRVKKCKPEITINLSSSTTHKGEIIHKSHLRTTIPKNEKDKIIAAAERYISSSSSSDLRKKRGRLPNSSLTGSRTKHKLTPEAEKSNPLSIANKKGENTPEREQRKISWSNTIRRSINSEVAAESDSGMSEDARKLQLYHFDNRMGPFSIPEIVGDRNTTRDKSDDESEDTSAPLDGDIGEDYTPDKSDGDDTYKAIPIVEDVDGDCARFKGYKFQDSIDDELPDCDAEDYEEMGLDGITPAMEVDGRWNNEGDVRINYVFDDPPTDTPVIDRTRYAPEKSALREGIPSTTWKSPLDCFFWTSGMNEEFFDKIAAVMTDYANEVMTEKGSFGGYPFAEDDPFTAVEVIRCLGIILKISLDGRDSGTYRQYFIASHQSFSVAEGRS